MVQELPLLLGDATPVHTLRLADTLAAQLESHKGLPRCVPASQEQDVALPGGNTVNIVAYTVAEVDPLVRQFPRFGGHHNAVALSAVLQIFDLFGLCCKILALLRCFNLISWNIFFYDYIIKLFKQNRKLALELFFVFANILLRNSYRGALSIWLNYNGVMNV